MRKKWIKMGYRLALVCGVISLILQLAEIKKCGSLFLIVAGIFLAGTSLCNMITKNK